MKTQLETLPVQTLLEKEESREVWQERIVAFGVRLGLPYAAMAIFPSHDTPVVSGNAFLHTNLPPAFLTSYDRENMGEIDPLVRHCATRSTPLIWSAEEFSGTSQRRLYAEVNRFGMRSGIVLPFHGPSGEFGMLGYATGEKLDTAGREAMTQAIPELACFRDSVMDVFAGMVRKTVTTVRNGIEITSREMECLKWCAAGKSSWDIANLMNCSEATVNFHFGNIRRKFGASSRQAAVIKAIRLGFLSL